jgi:dienelactone hydrolase
MRSLVLSTLAVAGAGLVLAVLILAFRFEGAVLTPTGRFGVGTRTVVWSDPKTERTIPVAFAYPSEGPAGVAIGGAAPLERPKHPLVVLAPDAGSTTTFYRSLAYELASNGFVVAMVGLPGIERFTRFPDHVAQWDERGKGARAARDAQGWARATSDGRYIEAAKVAASDVSFTLDKINESAHDRLDPLYMSIRVGDVAFVGHGVGGTAAVLACRDDKRCDAVATIDGPPADATPFGKPLLAVATGDDPHGLDALVSDATGATYSAVIAGTARLDVTDLPRVVPHLFLPSGSVAHPDRGTRGARDVLLAFALRHLMQLPVPMLDKPDVIEGVALTSKAAG